MEPKQCSPNAEFERRKKEMEERKRAAMAKMLAEKEDLVKKLQGSAKKEFHEKEQGSAQKLREIGDLHTSHMKEMEAKRQQRLDEFKILKSKVELTAGEIEAKEKALQEEILQKKHEAAEESRRQWSELEKQQEDRAIHDMMEYDELKIQMYMELDEKNKKAEERMESYHKDVKENTRIKLEKIKKDAQEKIQQTLKDNIIN